MLVDRCLEVVMDSSSSQTKLKNGLPQGSVLARVLISFSLVDIPDTTARKFAYADGWGLVASDKKMEITKKNLTKDLSTIDYLMETAA